MADSILIWTSRPGGDFESAAVAIVAEVTGARIEAPSLLENFSPVSDGRPFDGSPLFNCSSQSPFSICANSLCRMSNARSSWRISSMTCSRYLVYSFATSFGMRWVFCDASLTVGRLGLGAFLFLVFSCAGPFCASPGDDLPFCSSLLSSSFRRRLTRSRRASGLSLPLSYCAAEVMCGFLFSKSEILLKTERSKP